MRRLNTLIAAGIVGAVMAASPALASDRSSDPNDRAVRAIGGTEVSNGKYPFMSNLTFAEDGTLGEKGRLA